MRKNLSTRGRVFLVELVQKLQIVTLLYKPIFSRTDIFADDRVTPSDIFAIDFHVRMGVAHTLLLTVLCIHAIAIRRATLARRSRSSQGV